MTPTDPNKATKPDPNMAPDASPTGVRRVNRMPMYILGAVVVAFLIVMMMVASDRASQQHAATAKKEKAGGNSSMFASEIIGQQDGGLVPAATPPGLPDTAKADTTTTPPVPVAQTPHDDDLPPLPQQRGGTDSGGADDTESRIRMAKWQMFQEAVTAKTSVNVSSPRSAGSSQTTPKTREEMIAKIQEVRQQLAAESADPTAAYKAKLAQIQSAIGQKPISSPGVITASAKSSVGKDYTQFDGTSDRWQLNSKVDAPKPYELRAGFVLPATLISGINSELPGQIMAQVSQNVYDTATGKYLLIPQGSRLIGSYSSDVAYGQARVLVAWQRIVFPDGKALDIGSMPGADGAGYSGFHDQVNNHYLRIFSSALLMSGITAGISYSQDRNNNSSGLYGNNVSMSSEMSQALGQQLGQALAQMISKNLSIAPTLEIRPGYRFNVIVTKDITFSKPYQAFDY